ncbi:hypothetical protein EFE32_00400 [Lactococcus lactis subsp. lactis]|nr:hypothetical protein [Lactococcus lactis subsp. lactis]
MPQLFFHFFSSFKFSLILSVRNFFQSKLIYSAILTVLGTRKFKYTEIIGISKKPLHCKVYPLADILFPYAPWTKNIEIFDSVMFVVLVGLGKAQPPFFLNFCHTAFLVYNIKKNTFLLR